VTSVKFFLQKLGWAQFRIFSATGRNLQPSPYYSEH
jgi:hypothetical protein